MLTRRAYRFVVPAVILLGVFFLFQLRPAYLGSTSPSWSSFPRWKQQVEEQPPLKHFQETFQVDKDTNPGLDSVGGDSLHRPVDSSLSGGLHDPLADARPDIPLHAPPETPASPANPADHAGLAGTYAGGHIAAVDDLTRWPPGEEKFDAHHVSPTSSSTSVTRPVTTEDRTQSQSQTDVVALDPQAHRLRHADDFLPHFRAVLQSENITQPEAKATCDWPAGLKVNFQYADNDVWVVNEKDPEEIMQKRAEWHEFIATGLIPYSEVEDKFSGRGIIILAGNQNTVTRLKVSLRILGYQNSKLPVEVHYWEDELDEAKMADISENYHTVTFHDLSPSSNIFKTTRGAYINYNLKTAAVINSKFAEVLLMDSDNLATMDPEALFESDTYLEYGSLFWPDIARTRPENPMWAITNTPCRKDEYEQESGQLLVDKRRMFYHLQLAGWFNHQGYYNGFLLGDKDMFRFAWHALKTAYGKPRRWLTSVGVQFPDGKFCGHSFAQHHPNGSIAFFHGGLLKTFQPSLVRWLLNRTKLFESYKTSPGDHDPFYTEDIGIFYHGNEFVDPKPLYACSCTNMFNLDYHDLDELVPNFEEMFVKAGGMWIKEGEDY